MLREAENVLIRLSNILGKRRCRCKLAAAVASGGERMLGMVE